MKRWLAATLGILIALLAVAPAWAGDVFVKGYLRRDGTYVPPYYRSAPDGNPFNNWSAYPNINPYTGRQGTHRPWLSDGPFSGTGFRSEWGTLDYGSGTGIWGR